ncbi:MAG TPA: Rid family hydrolase [Micromonosporaceae bacterium]|jgi:enamine deaminase RidA (YjgF/YER057c/UK114 family)|nr:Rid family hydrolase [Micromonosporaceae bacterium]
MPLVRTEALASVAEYAYAAVVDPQTRLVFTAGACPLDADGRIIAPFTAWDGAPTGGPGASTGSRAAGATLADVVKSKVFVATADRAALVAVWGVVRDAFGDHDPPSTLLGVTVLGYPDQLVEVEAIAALPALAA